MSDSFPVVFHDSRCKRDQTPGTVVSLRTVLWYLGIQSPKMGATLWYTYKKLLKLAIEIVDLPIKNNDFP